MMMTMMMVTLMMMMTMMMLMVGFAGDDDDDNDADGWFCRLCQKTLYKKNWVSQGYRPVYSFATVVVIGNVSMALWTISYEVLLQCRQL